MFLKELPSVGLLGTAGTRLVVDMLGRSVGGGFSRRVHSRNALQRQQPWPPKEGWSVLTASTSSPNSGAAYPPGPFPLGAGCRDPGVLRVRDEVEMSAPHCKAFS